MSIFEFCQRFRHVRSAAIIGNAPCILDWPNGELIDSYDMVVRFNRATTEDCSHQVGSRTDVLFANTGQSCLKSPRPVETLKPKVIVCLVPPTEASCVDPTELLQWVSDVPFVLSFSPDILGVHTSGRCRPLTNGTAALYLLQKLFNLERLFITGFTFFGMVEGGSGKYWGRNEPQYQWSHDVVQEAQIFSSIVAQFPGTVTATPDVHAVLNKNGVRLSNGSNGKATLGRRRNGVMRRIADGLGWRLISVGSSLRRSAEV